MYIKNLENVIADAFSRMCVYEEEEEEEEEEEGVKKAVINAFKRSSTKRNEIIEKVQIPTLLVGW